MQNGRRYISKAMTAVCQPMEGLNCAYERSWRAIGRTPRSARCAQHGRYLGCELVSLQLMRMDVPASRLVLSMRTTPLVCIGLKCEPPATRMQRPSRCEHGSITPTDNTNPIAITYSLAWPDAVIGSTYVQNLCATLFWGDSILS